MKALKNLIIGEGANILTNKQMKFIKGGDPAPLYCHCGNDSGSIVVDSCDRCWLICSAEGWFVCDSLFRG